MQEQRHKHASSAALIAVKRECKVSVRCRKNALSSSYSYSVTMTTVEVQCSRWGEPASNQGRITSASRASSSWRALYASSRAFFSASSIPLEHKQRDIRKTVRVVGHQLPTHIDEPFLPLPRLPSSLHAKEAHFVFQLTRYTCDQRKLPASISSFVFFFFAGAFGG
jgi:hypothetical protein